MSAEREGANSFRMKHPIPAYLMALAVGDLQFRELGPRTGIYAEPPLLAAARREFEDTERMVEAVERLYGPYRWGRYELLILPPSFPFGGMENPIVTFATPTVIAGDKSLVGLVSHELAHSWSGNLVTNATWSDFWLNEGFTTYIENRIQEEVYGCDQALMEQVLDWRELERELSTFADRDQVLHIDLTGRDPDEGCTRVPYIKGALLLRSIEHAVGRERFDEFLRGYFEHFAFQSITTEQALDYMRPLFPGVDWHAWVYEPGLPPSAPKPWSERLERVAEGVSNAATWNTQEWVEFLQTLPRPVDMAGLDEQFSLNETRNAEILLEWLSLAIDCNYRPAYPRLEDFLTTVGRMRFLRPLYKALMKTQEGEVLARKIYARARPLYHPIAQHAIDRVLLFEDKTAGEQRVDP
jgi:leukotriene-A4 hydrolase